jgi:NAD(P)H-hydrate epimerase
MTFGALKTGHILGEGPDRCGVVNVANIGLPEGNAELLVTEEIDATRPARPRTAHKWSAGSVLVVGGSPGMTGAAILAGRAALNFGAGAVGLAVPDAAAATASASAPELLHYPIDDLPTRYQVLVIGPGLGLEQADLAAKLIADWSGPMVIDADALAALDSQRPLPNRSAVLTPHAGEFERLAGTASTYQAARALAEALEATVLLKGNPTFVTDGTTPWVIDTGGPELATIGTGDVLSGMLGALLARGLSPLEAARSAAYWHGRAGAELASRRTVTATALAEHVASIR